MQAELSLKTTADALEGCLRAEKAALIEGRYFALEELARSKEHLSARLDALLLDLANTAQQSAVRRQLAAIVKLAQENEGLMNAAKVGIISAKARIKDIINRQRNIGVYTESGERPFVPDACITRKKLA